VQLSRNAAGAVGFVIETAVLVVHDTVGNYQYPEWGANMPHAVHQIMPFGANVILPVMFFLVGYGVWKGLGNERSGFAVISGIAIFNILVNVPVTFMRLAAGHPQGAVICGMAALAGIVCLYFAIRAGREVGQLQGAESPRRYRTGTAAS
jgi:hypothetical protein